jgi:hypothetical protein
MVFQEKILHVRSQDCVYDSVSGIWTTNIPEGIACSIDEYIRIEVINAAIPYSFYNINETNRFLDIRESEEDGSNPVSYTLVLPIGNYNVIQFCSIFQSTINTLSASSGKSFTYTVAYDKFLNKATFVVSSANAKCEFLIASGVNERINAQFLMGFTLKDFAFTTSTSLTSDATMNMSPYDAVYIYSNLGITNAYDTKTKNLSNILIKIPITTLPFSYIQYENDQLTTFASYRSTIQSIEFSLKDMDGFDFNLNNGNWFISIKFVIEKKESTFRPTRPDELVELEM